MEDIKKVNNKKILIALITVAIIIGIILTIIFTRSTDSSKDYNITIEKPDGVEVRTYISYDKKQLIVSVVNKTGKTMEYGYIYANYYDKDNNKIGGGGLAAVRYSSFEDGKEMVFGFDIEEVKNGKTAYCIPDRTEVIVTCDQYYESSEEDEISYSYSPNPADNSINIFLKNNSNMTESAPSILTAVFYKKNKPIYAKEIMFFMNKIEPGETISDKINIPKDDEKSEKAGYYVPIDYDSIKIYKIRKY